MEPETKKNLIRCAERLKKLIELDAPTSVILHEVTGLFLPKVARMVGTKPVADAVGQMFLRLLNQVHGRCQMCSKNSAIKTDLGRDYCAACYVEAGRLDGEE